MCGNGVFGELGHVRGASDFGFIATCVIPIASSARKTSRVVCPLKRSTCD
jgi:hypothetical protein